MNLGLLMSIGSPGMSTASPVSTISGTGASGFGSVFQNMIASSEFTNGGQSLGSDGKLAKLMDDIMNAKTVEELASLLDGLKQSEQKSPVVAYLLDGLKQSEQKLPVVAYLLDGLKQSEQKSPVDSHLLDELKQSEQNTPVVAHLLDELKQSEQNTPVVSHLLKELGYRQSLPTKTPVEEAVVIPQIQKEQVDQTVADTIEVITNVLEVVGVTKEQLEKIQATEDIWFVLDTLQTIPPEKIQLAFQQYPEKVIVEMTVLFKAVELAAPKMDLDVGQVQLVKTIRPILAQFATMLEDKAVKPEVKQTIQLPSAMQHMIRLTTEQSAADAKQQDQQAKPSETPSIQSVLPQTESRPVFQMTQVEKAPESRSEVLMREFQAILNRANFGQTNGMNRLSIKLYPEHLGHVRIELLEVNGVMTARILASTAMAREMLDSQMHQLRHAFNQQNLQVDRIDLSQTVQDPSKNDREQAFNKQNSQQKEQPTERDQQQDEHEMTFEEFMIELEV
ncbi:flagellar hook-length control protein FliK [Sporosarcina sp. GW1-11]|uniref:flagellar hook-length control protein FliK n=1 Tax=Sporosarcina sp. GW1-11 TaxID=2899126 RepID=UPI00294E7B92|nr:flagellar hook-length control protein FliK [Sporosarcina sp. GW1-11]MDV6376713.1 flagellar hook-length control protein FliK [Sporosarcina sp. GW1-11]